MNRQRRSPSASVRRLALFCWVVLSATSLAQTKTSPRFEDYPSPVVFSGRPAPVVLSSARYGRTFRTRLRNGAQKGPNFAGAFALVTWGCGSSCQVSVVIDTRTGVLSRQMLRTTHGLEYRRDSRLVLVDPVRPGDPPPETCAVCGTPAAYEWTGTGFKPIGPGPHEHLTDDRQYE